MFCAFWLRNVLRAAAAYHFCGSEVAKSVPHWCFLFILTCKCASRHSRVPFFICLLNSYLRTRRFSEAFFRTWIIKKNTAVRDVLNIWCTCGIFLVTLLVCWSSFQWFYMRVDFFLLTWHLYSAFHSCWLDIFTLLFNFAYCRKLDFQTSFDNSSATHSKWRPEAKVVPSAT